MNTKDKLIAELNEKLDYWWGEYESHDDGQSQRALGHARGYEGALTVLNKHLSGMAIVSIGFLKATTCPNAECMEGTIAVQVDYNTWEPEQCQWCYEKAEMIAAQGNDNE